MSQKARGTTVVLWFKQCHVYHPVITMIFFVVGFHVNHSQPAGKNGIV
jgi:hypothetical protein